MHLQKLLNSSHKVPVAIKDYRHNGQIAMVAAVPFSKTQLPYVDVCQDGEFCRLIARLEELRVQVDGQFAHLFLRKDSILDFLLGLLIPAGGLFGSKISPSRLYGKVLRRIER